jgi:hypothetical protein
MSSLRRYRSRTAAAPGAAHDDAMPRADNDRVFGQFGWNTYSPAGTVERLGFLWRQLRRRQQRDLWTAVGYVIYLVVAAPFLVQFVAMVEHALS